MIYDYAFRHKIHEGKEVQNMPNAIAQAVQDFINTIYAHFFAFLTAMAAVGVLSMAILQTIKDTFPVRRAFQRQWLKKWFVYKSTEAVGSFQVDPIQAERDLIKLATDNNENAFYDLPIEQLCGQFNAAIQVALDSPGLHRNLVIATAALADTKDLDLLFGPSEAVQRTITIDEPNISNAEIDQRRQFIDARTRVTHQIQRGLDAIRISAGFRWKFYLQCASFGLSALIAGLSVGLFLHGTPGGKAITVIVTGILGGFLAPVARDLVAALQQLKK